MSNIYTEKALSGLASDIAAKLKGHENIYLSGELGAGKTTFTKKLLAHLGVKSSVKSPSYQIIDIHNIDDTKKVAHIDLYRLDDINDIAILGLEDILDDQNTIAVIEWPERAEHLLPEPNHHLHFTHRSPDTRTIEINNIDDE